MTTSVRVCQYPAPLTKLVEMLACSPTPFSVNIDPARHWARSWETTGTGPLWLNAVPRSPFCWDWWPVGRLIPDPGDGSCRSQRLEWLDKCSSFNVLPRLYIHDGHEKAWTALGCEDTGPFYAEDASLMLSQYVHICKQIIKFIHKHQ